MGDITPRFNPQIFRADYPIILACNAHLAKILPVWVDYQSGGYLAGTVMGLNSDSNNYGAYSNSASSGLGTAIGVLLDPVDMSASTGVQAARLCVGGELYYDKLVGIDSPALADLYARKVTDGTGTNVLIF